MAQRLDGTSLLHGFIDVLRTQSKAEESEGFCWVFIPFAGPFPDDAEAWPSQTSSACRFHTEGSGHPSAGSTFS